MKRIGTINPSGPARKGPDSKVREIPADALLKRAQAANFAESKMTWAMQVAADKRLSETALRVVLVWPFWLNSKTLTPWPSQSTIAEEVNSSDRAVRNTLKQLEDCGHLICLNQTRGGRSSNRYRFVINDVVLSAVDEPTTQDESGTTVPVTAAQPCQPERNVMSGPYGSVKPVSGEAAFRRTLERTFDKTREVVPIPANQPEQPNMPRVSKERKDEIMRQAFGTKSVSATGHLRRE